MVLHTYSRIAITSLRESKLVDGKDLKMSEEVKKKPATKKTKAFDIEKALARLDEINTELGKS